MDPPTGGVIHFQSEFWKNVSRLVFYVTYDVVKQMYEAVDFIN